jgi:hypothetical protein
MLNCARTPPLHPNQIKMYTTPVTTSGVTRYWQDKKKKKKKNDKNRNDSYAIFQRVSFNFRLRSVRTIKTENIFSANLVKKMFAVKVFGHDNF